MKTVVIVTASFPYGHGEGFLVDEIEELAALVDRLIIVPVHPRGDRRADWVEPVNAVVMQSPLRAALRATAVSTRMPAIAMRWMGRGSWMNRHTLRNLAGVAVAAHVIPHLAHEQVSHVHAYWLSVPATVAMVLGSELGVGWSASAHRWDIYDANQFAVKSSSAAFVRAISRRGADTLRGDGFEKVEVVPLGVRTPSGVCVVVERPRILCPASLIPVKGQRFLIEAAALLQLNGVDVEVDFAGEGPDREALQDQVDRLGVRNVRMVGQIPRTDLLSGYRGSQWRAVVLPSLELSEQQHEGIPVALVEAMRTGVPVVSTRSGSIPELLGSCRYVALVDPGDAQALADALLPLVTDDQAWLAAQGEVLRASAPWNARSSAGRLARLMAARTGGSP